MSSLASCLGRNNFRAHRLGVLATNREELETQLSSALAFLAEGSYHFRTPTGLYYGSGPGPLGVVGMFPGLGSTYSGMIDELSQISPVTRRWFTVYGDSLSRIRRVCRVRPDELVHAEYSIPVEPRLLDDDAHSALIASLALHDLCLSLSICFDYYVGHSNGEHAALIASGALDLPDIYSVADFVAQIDTHEFLTKGNDEAMVAVSGLSIQLLESEVAKIEDAYVASDNCSKQVIIGGKTNAVGVISSRVRELGGQSVRVSGLRAHHTPCFSDGESALRSEYGKWPFRAPRRPLYSCYLADEVQFDGWDVADVIAKQWTHRVRFRDTVKTLFERGAHVFLEIGPDSRLKSFVNDILRGDQHLAVSLSSRDRTGPDNVSRFLAELYAAGVPFDITRLDHVMGNNA
jgi:acyl transferase domain-containing protein